MTDPIKEVEHVQGEKLRQYEAKKAVMESRKRWPQLILSEARPGWEQARRLQSHTGSFLSR